MVTEADRGRPARSEVEAARRDDAADPTMARTAPSGNHPTVNVCAVASGQPVHRADQQRHDPACRCGADGSALVRTAAAASRPPARAHGSQARAAGAPRRGPPRDDDEDGARSGSRPAATSAAERRRPRCACPAPRTAGGTATSAASSATVGGRRVGARAGRVSTFAARGGRGVLRATQMIEAARIAVHRVTAVPRAPEP